MAITNTVILSDGGTPRAIVYQCTDSQGATYRYGPVVTVDPAFDATAHMVVVAARVAGQLAAAEAEQIIGGA